MKVRNRPVKCDMLLIDDQEYRLSVMTHRQKIIVRLEKNGKLIADNELNFAQFTGRLTQPESETIP